MTAQHLPRETTTAITPQGPCTSVIASRRYDLDWLRVIAFAVLIFFHSAIVFIPNGIPNIHNSESSAALRWFVQISHHFRLALLFLISGIGVGFAFRRRSARDFITERTKRLLIPFAVAILTVVPPIVYFEKVFQGETSATFWEFYPTFFTAGVYPQGNLSWHHMWFVFYLYLFCLIGLPLFKALNDGEAPRIARLRSWGRSYGIFAFVVPLFLVEVALRALFPGGVPNLVTDWANFFHYFLIFLAGYVVSRDEEILHNVQRVRFVSLAVAIASTALLHSLFYRDFRVQLSIHDNDIVIKYLSYCFIRVTLVWSSILTCLGFASRYLNAPSRALRYLNESVYPLYILHLLAIVALAYYVVQWDVDLRLKYLSIVGGTFLIVLATYHLAIRPSNVLRLLFGVKSKEINPIVAK
jgi:peptidoglycan/LPS O-acetylase OafA/YrhL